MGAPHTRGNLPRDATDRQHGGSPWQRDAAPVWVEADRKWTRVSTGIVSI